MSSPKPWVAGLLVLGLSTATQGRAQTSGAPVIPGGAPTAASSALGAAPAAAAAPRTIWGMFGLSSANIHACIEKLCRSQLGMMANNMITGPMGAVSAGFIPPLCPVAPTADQIAAMNALAPGGAAATAAKIKASEADAKARVAAVEYLGTVDCSRWKEATTALVNSLRADPNECVRYAAARVLNSGCCCNKATIEALRVCVSGEETDGNPPETSSRVKAAAFGALQNCLTKVPEILPVEEVKPTPAPRERGNVPSLEPLPNEPLRRERSTMSGGGPTHLAASHTEPVFEGQSPRRTFAQTVTEARQTLFDVSRTAKPPSTLPPGRRSVFDALVKARQEMARKGSSAATPPSPATADPLVSQPSDR